jgi:hypothetical protein
MQQETYDTAHNMSQIACDRPATIASDLPDIDHGNTMQAGLLLALQQLLPAHTGEYSEKNIKHADLQYTVAVFEDRKECILLYIQMLRAWAWTPYRPYGAFVKPDGQVLPFTDMDGAFETNNRHIIDFFIAKHSGYGVLVDPSAVQASSNNNWTTAQQQVQGMHNKGLCFGKLPPDSFKCLSNGNVYVFGNYWEMHEQNVYMGLKWLLHADQGNKQISSLLHQLSLDRPLQDAPWQPTRWNQAQAAEAEMMQTNCLNTRGTMRGDTSWMQGTALAKCRQFLQNYDLACLRNHSRVNI